MAATRTGRGLPLSGIQIMHCIPRQKNEEHFHNEENCTYCESIHLYRLNPDAKEFVPRESAGIENADPACIGAGGLGSLYSKISRWHSQCYSPSWDCKTPATLTQPRKVAYCAPSEPKSAATWCAGSAPAEDSCQNGESSGGPASAVSRGEDAPAARPDDATNSSPGADQATARQNGGSGSSRPPAAVGSDAGCQSRLAAAALNHTRDGVAAESPGSAVVSPMTAHRVGPVTAPADKNAEFCRKIRLECVRAGNGGLAEPCVAEPEAQSRNATAPTDLCDIPSAKTVDSLEPRRATSTNSCVINCSTFRNPSASSSKPTSFCRCISSDAQLETLSSDNSLAAGSNVGEPALVRAGRCCPRSPLAAATSDESDGDSSDSDDDSTVDDEEWDSSTAAYLPSSSVDSADDFICFIRDDEPALACVLPSGERSPATPGILQTPVFGPGHDQGSADSGLSAETDLTDSHSEDSDDGNFSEDETDGSFDSELWRRLSISPMSLSFQPETKSVVPAPSSQCDACQRAPVGTCLIHQRIAEANRKLNRRDSTPPPKQRTSRVRFVSGDRLATVHAAPEYDRTIASDLLDQQRQRDRLRLWRQEVDRQVAPVVAAVLTPEHRQRVLRQRPELVCS